MSTVAGPGRLDSRTTKSGSKIRRVCRCSGFFISSMSSSAASRPSCWRGCRTEDNGTAAAAAKSMSSYPRWRSRPGRRAAGSAPATRPRRAGRWRRTRRVGARRPRAAPATRSAASPSGRHGQLRGSSTPRSRRVQAGGAHRLAAPRQAVATCPTPRGPADEGDPPVALLDQVRGGEMPPRTSSTETEERSRRWRARSTRTTRMPVRAAASSGRRVRPG